MKDIYKLAIKLNIPIVLTEAWEERRKRIAKGGKNLLMNWNGTGYEADRIYKDAVRKEFGKGTRINWNNGEVRFLKPFL